jgi:hypothetical protein
LRARKSAGAPSPHARDSSPHRRPGVPVPARFERAPRQHATDIEIRDNFPLSGIYPRAIIPRLGRGIPFCPDLLGKRVQDHLGSNRRLAFRAVAFQAAVALLAGLVAGVVAGRIAGFAACIGAASMALANAAQAQIALGGGVQVAGSAFARLLLGTLAKWFLVVAVWWGAIAVVGAAPIAALCGLFAAALVHPLVVFHGSRMKRER